MSYSPEEYVSAMELIKDLQNELDCGTKFFNRNGRLLTTVKAIITVIQQEGKVSAEPTEERKKLFRQQAAYDGAVPIIGEGGPICLKKP
jgi:hypothetical protein